MSKVKYNGAREIIRNSFISMGVNVSGDRQDLGQKGGVLDKPSVKISDSENVKYYPWGRNNKLPFELMNLLNSNADMLNLLSTKVDFLVGGGIGLFVDTEQQSIELKSKKIRDWFRKKKINELANAYYTDITQLANVFIDVDKSKEGGYTLKSLDPTTVRVVIPEDKGEIKEYVVSYSWDGLGKKEAKKYPKWNAEQTVKTSIIHHKPKQPGQFYYGFAGWSSLKPVIDLANKIPNFHNNGLDTEGVLGHIFHVSKQYFVDLQAEFKKPDGSPYTLYELEEAFKEEADGFLFGEGKNKMLLAVSGYDVAKGTMNKHIEIEPIKRNMTGDEYMKLAQYAVWTMSNGSGLLGGLSGVSDGKMNSGGGTEIRISAEYQQFYRTFRHREPFLNLLNDFYLPELHKLGFFGEDEDVYFGHRNVLLQTLDVNKTGVAVLPDGETTNVKK